jgi:dienelactone hydrolase
MYDPFSRGAYPVGVRTETLKDKSRNERPIPLEIWYPASEEHRGGDLAPQSQDRYVIFGGHQVRQEAVRDAQAASGSFPVVLFSHGFAGHRRQSTFFCTHLASHGYFVLALDHGGNTLNDMVQLAMRVASEGIDSPKTTEQLLGSYVFDRPRDVSYVLDALACGAVECLRGRADPSDVGVSGHSFGGWTTLVAAGLDRRIRAALPMAPAGAPGPMSARALEERLTLPFDGRVDTLYLALERDTLLPLQGIVALFRRTPMPARMLVLLNADHMHFCDRVERSHEFFRVMPQIGPMKEVAKRLPPMSELVPGAHSYLFANGMGTAHMDAVLKGSPEARALLSDHAVAALAQRGVVAEEVTYAEG